MRAADPRYVIISPVKDEERYVELTLRSVTEQAVPPVLWVVVDDGSEDRTPDIVRRYAAEHPYIRLLQRRKAGARRPGSPVIHAFSHGYASLGAQDYDFIVKLDCDLSFEPDYFQKLLSRFQDDERLGIASGVYLESDSAGRWTPVKMPAYHAFGASKVVRRTCFEEIGGFPAAPGWDTVDEIRAMAAGWRTTHFSDLPARHHKREGSGIGRVRTSRMHGEIFYVTGGDPLFLALKVLHRLTAAPYVINALALTMGYVGAIVKRKPRLVTPAEARCYKRLLRARLLGRANREALNALPSRR
ncbi:MAG: glycosyltransferase family 2 protein [Acidobacteria bacterium]|nr:glycosyltransferase family 2 protein [Acidobacteriota bacterium]MCA1651990.1 glycosyltransferase family 2 protein [Acidobacteriota bacterium]